MQDVEGSVGDGLARSEDDSLSRVAGELLLGHVFPASLFGIMLVAKVVNLFQYYGASAETSAIFAAHIAQQILGALFLSVLVVLVMIRRGTIGRRSSPFRAGVALLGTLLIMAPISAPVVDQEYLLAVSSIVMGLGTSLAIVSLLFLGRCFGIFPEARGLVTRGPYRWIRHPVYLGEIVAAFGAVVATWSPAMLGLFLAWFALQYWRTRMEESALAAVFPGYAEYRERTYRLCPPFR